ncbi:hypothetical protein A9R05_05175 [Burkholderia sp. KK1]|nr:hypothetical protein A9R05_05175 [Burkholderia sp. KK1]
MKFDDVPRSSALRGIADILRRVHHSQRADGAFFFVWPRRAMALSSPLSLHPDSFALAINAGLQYPARHE